MTFINLIDLPSVLCASDHHSTFEKKTPLFLIYYTFETHQSWSIEILDKMRIDEDEWVVRDLAQHVFELFQTGSPYLPVPQPPLHTAAWLRTFSEQHNLAVHSPESALELLLTALEKGSDEQKQAALIYLRRLFNSESIPALLKLLQDSNPDVSQLAALTLWFCAPPGFKFTSASEKES